MLLSWIRRVVRAWRLRRLWSIARQLEYLRLQLDADARTVADNPEAAALVARYRAMLEPDFFRDSLLCSQEFRDSLAAYRPPRRSRPRFLDTWPVA